MSFPELKPGPEHIPCSETCTVIPLTLRLGSEAGTTRVYCTCGWERTYKTRRGAIRQARIHVKNSTPRPTKDN